MLLHVKSSFKTFWTRMWIGLSGLTLSEDLSIVKCLKKKKTKLNLNIKTEIKSRGYAV